MKLRIPRLPANLRRGLMLATRLVDKIPQRGDSSLTVAVKLLAATDQAAELFGELNPLTSLVQDRGLVKRKSEQFVSLFFDTKLADEFHVSRYSLTEHLDALDASHKGIGDVLFAQSSYQDSPHETFYHAKDFDFAAALTKLWDVYDDRIYVEIRPTPFGGTKTSYGTFQVPPNPLFGAQKSRMEKLVGKHRRYQTDKVSRTYMFYGEPGTGKTSFALEFCARLHGRVLKLDATGLASISMQNIEMLVDGMRPDFLVIDDLDKADTARTMPILLDILQRFKTDYQHTSVIITSNTVDKFDHGLLRPTRIDSWEYFPLPDATERRDVLTDYMRQTKTHIDVNALNLIVHETEGLSQDYLREIVSLFRYDDCEDVVGRIRIMKSLLGKTKVAAEAAKAETKPSA